MGGELLLRELEVEDQKMYTNALRMNSERFNQLLAMIEGDIQKQDTDMRLALPACLKLEITLRYLASGDSFKSLSLFFRVPGSSMAINTALSSVFKVSKFPTHYSIMYQNV